MKPTLRSPSVNVRYASPWLSAAALGLTLAGCGRNPETLRLVPTAEGGEQASQTAQAEQAEQATAGDAGAVLPRLGTFGMVRDASSGEPILGATVRLRIVDPGAEFGAESSGDSRDESSDLVQQDFAVASGSDPPGQYRYEAGLPEGVARIEVRAAGYDAFVTYQNHWYTADCPGGPCARFDFELWPEGSPREELPDLLPNSAYLQASQVSLTNDCDSRDDVSICLRAAIGTANMGAGDLFLSAPPEDLAKVTQHVFDSEGGIEDVSIRGDFEHHDAHRHIHVGDWSRLTLRPIDDRCDSLPLGDRCEPIGEARNASYCLHNNSLVDAAFNAQRLFDCSAVVEDAVVEDAVEQGISSGYMDIDPFHYAGQLIDVTGLPDGEYWLETAVNPDRAVLESDYSNNVVRARYRLELPECGDGKVEFPESCEGEDLDGWTCESIDERFTGGELRCNATCGFDRSGCTRAVCEPTDLGSALGIVADGDIVSGWDSADPRGCPTPNGTGRDVAFSWTAPETGRYNIKDGLESLFVYVRDGTCDGPELGCATDLAPLGVDVDAEKGQTLVIVVDLLPTRTGTYVLTITGPL